MPAGAAEPTGTKVGDAPPVDELGKDASSNRIHLSYYRGKIVVISFWASGCGPWMRSMRCGTNQRTPRQVTLEAVYRFYPLYRFK